MVVVVDWFDLFIVVVGYVLVVQVVVVGFEVVIDGVGDFVFVEGVVFVVGDFFQGVGQVWVFLYFVFVWGVVVDCELFFEVWVL